MKKYKVGYTQGVYDMFHIGHLRLLNRAKEQCETLIVGVNADRLVEAYKHKTPVIGEAERQEIVSNIKAVDRCVIADTLDKVKIWEQLHFDAIFIGDDWKGNERWARTGFIFRIPRGSPARSSALKRVTASGNEDRGTKGLSRGFKIKKGREGYAGSGKNRSGSENLVAPSGGTAALAHDPHPCVGICLRGSGCLREIL